MRRRPSVVMAALAAGTLLAGCLEMMPPVPFEGSPADWEALAGSWRGDYSTRTYDRHGTIAFNLSASTAGASGEVLMISDRSGWPFPRYAPHPGGPPFDAVTELLSIRFVRATDGWLSGRLNSYWDPDRRCEASAAFRGSADGDRISGTFTSRCVDDSTRILSGRWTVHRQR